MRLINVDDRGENHLLSNGDSKSVFVAFVHMDEKKKSFFTNVIIGFCVRRTYVSTGAFFIIFIIILNKITWIQHW